MYRRSPRGWAKHWDFILIDTVCLQISLILAYWLRYRKFFVYSSRNPYRTSAIVLFFLSIVVAIFFNTMHNVLTRGLLEEIKCTIIQCAMVFAGIVILLFTSKDSTHVSRIVMYLAMILYFVMGLISRRIYRKIFLARKKVVKKREMVLVGDEQGIRCALSSFKAHPEEGVNVKSVVRVDAASKNTTISDNDENSSSDTDKIHTVDLENAAEFIRNEWIDEVYIAVADPNLMPFTLISQCSEMAVTVHQQIFTRDDLSGRQWVEKIAKQPVLTTSINIPGPRQLMIKRAADIVSGVILSVLSIIVLIICGPFIKLSSRGPVILRYERIGQNGRKFKMFMIRTMYMDAKDRGNGQKVIKGIGAFMRRWSLDELPKGFNVLLGEMSLVGTRAPSVEEWEGYQFRHRARLACKPGITGLWQVCSSSSKSGNMSFEEATSLDTEYITNWNIGLDLKILFAPGKLRKQYSGQVFEESGVM